jgi:hypothetical protein
MWCFEAVNMQKPKLFAPSLATTGDGLLFCNINCLGRPAKCGEMACGELDFQQRYSGEREHSRMLGISHIGILL